MTHPVFWEIVPPNGAQLTLVGGQTLGNMQMAHAVRLSFPVEHQAAIAEWLRRTADFLSTLPQGQSMQVPPPAPLQQAPAQAAPAPMVMPQMAPQPEPQQPAAFGHNPMPVPSGAPIGHNAMPMPPAFGGASPTHAPSVAQAVTPPPAPPPMVAATDNLNRRPEPANAPPQMGFHKHPQIANPHAHVLGEDNEPFASMTPGGSPAPRAAPAAPPTQPAPPPSRTLHAWDKPYEIGVSRCTRCHLVATGIEERYCG